MTGWPCDEARNRCVEEIYKSTAGRGAPSVAHRIEACWAEDAEAGGSRAPKSLQMLLVRRDGCTVAVRESLMPVRSAAGGVTGAVLLFEYAGATGAEDDSTELLTRVFMNHKLASLRLLASGVAHDFNNLLQAIMGHADLALNELPGGHAAVSDIAGIRAVVTQAAALTSQMLDYCGERMHATTPIDLSSLVSGMQKLLEASEKKVLIRYRLASLLPPVRGDAEQLGQVLMSLVSNAREALADETGEIRIATYELELRPAQLEEVRSEQHVVPGPFVCLEVRDVGCGMTAPVEVRMFDPFFSTKAVGRGLGLASAWGILAAHDGAVLVDTKPQCGTRVRLLFPPAGMASAPSAPETPADWAAAAHLISGTVLVVDDDAGIRDLARRILELEGLHVLCACDGQDALRMFEERPDEIDLVILDLTMPRMAGAATLQRLRKVRADAAILLSSGFTAATAERRFAADQACHFLQKPYSRAALVQQVRLIMGTDVAPPAADANDS